MRRLNDDSDIYVCNGKMFEVRIPSSTKTVQEGRVNVLMRYRPELVVDCCCMASKRALLTIISRMLSERFSQGLEPLSFCIAHFFGFFFLCLFLTIYKWIYVGHIILRTIESKLENVKGNTKSLMVLDDVFSGTWGEGDRSMERNKVCWCKLQLWHFLKWWNIELKFFFCITIGVSFF